MKARINELKNQKAASSFKSAEEIDKEIARLDAQVESGKMKLVDEKKALADISSYRKQKKAFAGFDEKQKEIDKLKAQIAEVKAGMDKVENKAEQDEYTKIKTELDAIFDAEGKRKGGLNQARDELREARNKQDKLYQEFKEYKDQYYEQKRQAYAYEREAAKVRDAKRKAERDAYLKEKRQYQLKQRIEDASVDAYLDEIRASDSILRLLDPNSASTSVAPETSKFAATAQRTVTDDGLEGKRINKKDEEEEDYFAGTGGKKGKKGKKGPKQTLATPTPAAPSSKAMNRFWQPGVIEQFALVGVEAPATAEQIPEVAKKVQEKKAFWQQDQKRKTQEVRFQADLSRISSCANINCRISTTRRRRLKRKWQKNSRVAPTANRSAPRHQRPMVIPQQQRLPRSWPMPPLRLQPILRRLQTESLLLILLAKLRSREVFQVNEDSQIDDT